LVIRSVMAASSAGSRETVPREVRRAQRSAGAPVPVGTPHPTSPLKGGGEKRKGGGEKTAAPHPTLSSPPWKGGRGG